MANMYNQPPRPLPPHPDDDPSWVCSDYFAQCCESVDDFKKGDWESLRGPLKTAIKNNTKMFRQWEEIDRRPRSRRYLAFKCLSDALRGKSIP